MRQDIDLSAFSKGELSPRLKGRTDYKGYFEGCETMLNMVVLPQGGATRRPGTIFAALTKTQTDAATPQARLIDFQFSTVQAYVLEFGAAYIRIFKDGAPVVDGGGNPIEVSTPYTMDQVNALHWCQSNDVLYLCDAALQVDDLAAKVCVVVGGCGRRRGDDLGQ